MASRVIANENAADEQVKVTKAKLAAAGEHAERINAADAKLRAAGEAYAMRAKEVGEALRDAKADCGRAGIHWSEWCPKHGPKYTVQHADRLIRIADEWDKIQRKMGAAMKEMSLRAVLAILPKKSRRNQNADENLATVDKPRLLLEESAIKEAAKQARIIFANAKRFLDLLNLVVKPEKNAAAAA
ncbi:MAG: hypothetical protein JWO38_960 [Gemmataceae bacterium]|nr:hypothetical protein [Gemmataceae bacterium]